MLAWDRVTVAAKRSGGLVPRPAIASQKEQQTDSELSDAVRARLCELPIVYILILAASTLWSRGVLGWEDATIVCVDGTIILALMGLIALLRSRCAIPLTWLQALELGAIGLLAGRVAFVEYRLMLSFSQRGDMMTAPMVLKSAVLLTAVLILTYGLYVPKTWRRAALVAGPLALLPFATLSILALQHPAAMAWLWEGWLDSQTPRALLFAFDALILAILAVGSAYGARTIFRLRQVCGALREAHAAGLIHRDIKPSNIFAARPGGLGDVAKLLDFGLVLPAAILGETTLTGEREILGTPLYMSPEQAKGGHKLDARSDIYSLGAVAYYLLTGRPPFQANGRTAVLIAHARDPVEPPSRVRPGIPEDLERVVLRCLVKPPDQRFPDALALEQALGACACAGDWDQGRAAQWWQGEYGDPS